MKARPVKKLDPAAPLADNAERIIRVRLDELCGFVPRVLDPDEVEALHDMRIAAKRLRYILEVTGPCFGPYAKQATKLTKSLQDVLGEIHDCDEMIPRVTAHLDAILLTDAAAIRDVAGGAADLDPKLVAEAPNLDAYSGLAALLVYLQARRELLYARFLEFWRELQRDGFRARLEFAVSERSEEPPAPPPEDPDPDAGGDGRPLVAEPGQAATEDAIGRVAAVAGAHTPERDGGTPAPPVEPPGLGATAAPPATPGPDPAASSAAPDAAATPPVVARRRTPARSTRPAAARPADEGDGTTPAPRVRPGRRRTPPGSDGAASGS